MSQKLNHDAKSIGARFRSARSLVPDLNRKSFCERYGINRYTMQSWENGLHVSKGKNVEKFIEALAREGVYCTAEWLIDGIGEGARPHNACVSRHIALVQTEKKHEASDHFEGIISVLKDEHHKQGDDMVMCTVPDDSMAPKFLAGDTVIGKAAIAPSLGSLHQKYCIIEMSPGRFIVRKILFCKDGLLVLALDDRIPTFFLHSAETIYPIVWHLLKQ